MSFLIGGPLERSLTSPAVFEILRSRRDHPKVNRSRVCPFRVRWRHRSCGYFI